MSIGSMESNTGGDPYKTEKPGSIRTQDPMERKGYSKKMAKRR